jgi:hypothetical protein
VLFTAAGADLASLICNCNPRLADAEFVIP